MPNDILDAAVEYFASRSHAAWRRQFHKAHPNQKKKPRMRMRGGIMVDINKPWRSLDPRAKEDSRSAGHDAYEAVARHPRDREAASAYVHIRWMKRNERDPNQPKALFKPYRQLSEAEKDKDRIHVDNMRIALAAVANGSTSRRKSNGSAKQSAPPKANGAAQTDKRAAQPKDRAGKALRLDAETSQRLEAAARRLTAAFGRPVTAGELAHAGIRALLLIYEAAPPDADAAKTAPGKVRKTPAKTTKKAVRKTTRRASPRRRK
jgi:hypothetical protein